MQETLLQAHQVTQTDIVIDQNATEKKRKKLFENFSLKNLFAKILDATAGGPIHDKPWV